MYGGLASCRTRGAAFHVFCFSVIPAVPRGDWQEVVQVAAASLPLHGDTSYQLHGNLHTQSALAAAIALALQRHDQLRQVGEVYFGGVNFNQSYELYAINLLHGKKCCSSAWIDFVQIRTGIYPCLCLTHGNDAAKFFDKIHRPVDEVLIQCAGAWTSIVGHQMSTHTCKIARTFNVSEQEVTPHRSWGVQSQAGSWHPTCPEGSAPPAAAAGQATALLAP